MRGLNYRARRPNRILLDDVEDDEEGKSDTVRAATESWFYSAVEKAGVQMEGAVGEDWAQEPLRITNLGTLLGSECLMVTLSRDPDYSTVKFGAKLDLTNTEDTRMLWAYKMSYETYMKQRARHRLVGKLAEFTREIDSAIRVSDDSIFPSLFIYQPTMKEDLVARSMALDPALSDSPGADHAAIIVAGRRTTDGALWMLDEWGGTGKTPREKIDAFFDLHLKWNTTHNGIEAVQYQKALIFLMREEMARRKYFFHIVPIMQPRNIVKDARIVGILSPRYSNGYIRHLRPLAGLEGNLIDWPNGKKDYADAAAMALTLLGETQMLAMEHPEETSDGTPQYEPLAPPLPPMYGSGTHILRTVGDTVRSRYPL